jgi:hypothetical protein
MFRMIPGTLLIEPSFGKDLAAFPDEDVTSSSITRRARLARGFQQMISVHRTPFACRLRGFSFNKFKSASISTYEVTARHTCHELGKLRRDAAEEKSPSL